MRANAVICRSQTGGATEAPLACTGSPWLLFIFDIRLFFRNILYIPFIFLPVFPWPSGSLDELYPSTANLVDIAVHVLLFIYQLAFLVSVPSLAYLLPVPVFILYIVTALAFNGLICLHFNRGIPEDGLKPTEESFSQQWPRHDDEYWIFLNGICVGRNWLQNNIDRLSRTFHRPVVGVHNKTTGVIFDLIQCLIQRAFLYATSDIRDCYVLVKRALYKRGIKKVVLILHSQGGIEGGMILDWLLDEVPQDILQYLEVYTFGCLANHFSNPYRNHNSTAAVPREKNLPAERRRDLSISYIEHYANAFDFATRCGVLHFTQTQNARDGSFENRFMGRVFVNPAPGHLLNQHYLNTFFPLDHTTSFTREPRAGDFMNMEAQVEEREGERADGVETSLSLTANAVPDGTDGEVNDGTYTEMGLRAPKMWECSRLWQYRNGATPAPAS